jgi:hypothetical protein
MKSHVLFAAITLTAAFSPVEAVERPREFVERFCKAEESWAIRGLPAKHHEPLYDSFLGVELIQAIRSANSRLGEWIRKHRGGNENLMIPHIESNLFSGFSEGPTSWRVGRSNRTPLGVTVDVHREYREADAVYKWIDRVLLDRDGKGWVVRDIDCHWGGSLRGSILDFRNSIDVGGETAESKADKSRLATLRAAQVPWWIPAQPKSAGCQR